MIIAKVNQIIRYNGEYYSLKPGVVVPKMPKTILNMVLESGLAEDHSPKKEPVVEKIEEPVVEKKPRKKKKKKEEEETEEPVVEESEIPVDEHKIEEEEVNEFNLFGRRIMKDG